jgi:adenine-specific DNA-methyltransferase
MAVWNPRSPAAWADLLGMVGVPMFAPARSPKHPGRHAVILDGRAGSFSLSIGDLDTLTADLAGPVAWSWSANVRHSLVIDETKNVCVVRKWDVPNDIEEHSLPDVDQAKALPTQFEHRALPDMPTVIDRSLRVFRFVRNGVDQLGGNDVDSMKVFNSLLIWAEVIKATPPGFALPGPADLASVVSYLSTQKLLKYHPEDFSPPVRAYPLTEAVDLLINGEKDELYSLDADLLIRHASGTLFQEAHIEIDKSTRRSEPNLFGALWAGDEPRRGKPKRDAHFTPPSLARLLVEQTLAELRRTKGSLPPTISVIDPACGSGVFFHEMIREMSGRDKVHLDLHGFDNTTISRIMSEFSLARVQDEFAPGDAVFQVFQGDSLQMAKWGEPDIILMNPPFTSWVAMSDAERGVIKSTLGDWYSGHSDSAIAFIAKAVRSLRPGSVLGTVLPSALLESKAAAKFRRAVLRAPDISIRMIGRFRGYGYFHDAIIEPGFLVLSRHPKTDNDSTRIVLAETGHEEQAIRATRRSAWDEAVEGDGFELFTEPSKALSDKSWLPRRRAGDAFVRSLLAGGSVKTVNALFDTNLGVRAGLKRAFLFPATKLRHFAPTASERRFFRPIADTISTGRIIADKYIFYPYSADGKLALRTETELSRTVPNFYKDQLLPEREVLAKRKSQRKRKWWELVEPRPTWQPSFTPKIISPAFAERGRFAFDEEGRCVVVQGVAWIPRKGLSSDGAKNLWAYCAVLNSEPFERLLDFFCPRVGGGQYEVYPKYIMPVPLPDLNTIKPATLARLAVIGKDIAAGRDSDLEELTKLVCAAYSTSAYDFRRSLPLSEDERISQRFSDLASRWKKDTAHLSSMAQMARHESYKRILDLGPSVVPLIIADLRRRPAMWFHALQTLTGDNPVPKESRGNVSDMRHLWLTWASERGYPE